MIERGIKACQVYRPQAADPRFIQIQVYLPITRNFDALAPRGLDYDPLKPDATIDAAEAAVVRRFWREAPAASLTAWIERMAQRFTVTPPGEKKRAANSGKSRLAAALLGLPYSAATRAQLPFKALLRSLQRVARPAKPGRKESHNIIVSPEYRRLIDEFAGEESPFRQRGGVQMDRLADVPPLLSVEGRWRISERVYDPRRLDSAFIHAEGPIAAQTGRRVMAVLRNDGRDFIETVVYHVSHAVQTAAWLERVDELAIQGNVLL